MAATQDIDPGIAALLAQLPPKEGAAPSSASRQGAPAIAKSGSPSDPSLGRYPLQIGPWKTPIMLPQALSRTVAGVGQGMTDVTRHVGNLLGGVGGTTNQDLARSKAIDAPLLNTTAGKVGNFIGTTAATAPIGMGAGAGLSRLGVLGARLAASPLAYGAIQGAGQGALLADPGQRTSGALTGAALGAALPAAGGTLGTIARGLKRTPAAQTLIDAGVSLTPGQMNPTGVANRMEQALEGTPIIGDAAQNARDNAMKQYSRAMVERSMAPGATLLPNTTDFNKMVDEAAKSFDTAYDAGKGFPVGAKIVNQMGPDVPLQAALKSVTQRARPGITGQEQTGIARNLQDLLSQSIKDAKQKGGMESDDLLQLRSTLRDLGRGEPGTDNASRARASIYHDAANQVTQALQSQLPPKAIQALNGADQQYAKFTIIRNAAKAAKDAADPQKGPTPFQFSTAIAQATPPNTYARGGGLNRDLSGAARQTFQSNVPRTGLTGMGRLALPAAAAWMGKGLALAHPVATGIAALPLAGMAGLTLTRGGRAAAAGNTALQRALAGRLNQLGRAIPPRVARLPGLYGRSALLSLLAPRLQQMQQPPNP